MPYKRRAQAIKHYLQVIMTLAGDKGEFNLAKLPGTITINGHTYSKDTIHRYIKWVEWYLRRHDMPIPWTKVKEPKKTARGAVITHRYLIDRNLAEAILAWLDTVDDIGPQERARRRREEVERKLTAYTKALQKLADAIERAKTQPEVVEVLYNIYNAIMALTEKLDKVSQVIDDALLAREVAKIAGDWDAVMECVVKFIRDKRISKPCAIVVTLLDTATDTKDGKAPVDTLIEYYEENEEKYNHKIRKLKSQIPSL